MDFCGDPTIFTHGNSSDLEIIGGQPTMDAGIYNAVHISLFAYSDWWGNSIAAPAEKMISRLGELQRRTITPATRADAEEYAKQALAWMITEGMAKKIDVQATLPSVGEIALTVKVTQPDGQTSKYRVNWQATKIKAGLI